MTDEQIILALLGNVTQREMIFTWLYTYSGWHAWVVRYVSVEGGDQPAGEDIFQETIILFDRNIREGRYQKGSSLKTYFIGIARQYWFNRQRRIRPVSLTEAHDRPTANNPETIFLQDERNRLINQIIDHLGDHCKKVLELYKLSLSNEEIARQLGFSSPEMAKKYTYRCREQFRAFVLRHKETLEMLYSI